MDNKQKSEMVFEILYSAAKRGELLLIDGGMCHWHLRRDGQLTIHEIISTKYGAGGQILDYLKQVGAKSIFAKCPVDLEANGWYKKMGFQDEGIETTKAGRLLNLWRLLL